MPTKYFLADKFLATILLCLGSSMREARFHDHQYSRAYGQFVVSQNFTSKFVVLRFDLDAAKFPVLGLVEINATYNVPRSFHSVRRIIDCTSMKVCGAGVEARYANGKLAFSRLLPRGLHRGVPCRSRPPPVEILHLEA